MVEIPDPVLGLGTIGTIIGFFVYVWRSGRAWTKMEDKLEAAKKENHQLREELKELKNSNARDHAEVKQALKEIWQALNKYHTENVQRIARLEAKD